MKKIALLQNNVIFNSVIYSVSGLLLKCFQFFLLPLYTSHLTTQDYGVTSISTSFITTMGFIVAFSLFSAVLRFYVDLKEDPEKLRRFYGTVTVFVFISGIAFGAILCLLREQLCRYVFSGVDFFPVVFVSIISLIFSCQHHIYENILRSQQKAIKYSIIVIAYFFVVLVLNILFVVVLKMGAIGVVLTTMIGNMLYTVFFIVDMVRSKSITFCIDIPILKESLKYSVPIMPHNLSTQIAELVSKALIGGSNSLATLGLYSVASQFAGVAETIQFYINNAYGPWLYERLHEKSEGYKKNIAHIVNMLCGVIGFVFIGISLFSHDYIVLFINNTYTDAWKYIPMILTVFSIKTVYYFYVNVLFYYKEASRNLFIATLSSSLLNVLLSAVLIPKMGAVGSILADAVAMIIRVAVIIFISRKYEDIGLKIKSFVSNFFIVAIFMYGGHILTYFVYHEQFSIWNLLYKILILIIYVVYILCRFKKQIISFVNSLKKQ